MEPTEQAAVTQLNLKISPDRMETPRAFPLQPEPERVPLGQVVGRVLLSVLPPGSHYPPPQVQRPPVAVELQVVLNNEDQNSN